MDNGGTKREEIRNFVVDYIVEHGYSPTVREIGEGVGLSSSSSVYGHIKKMLESGMLETDAGYASPRALRVPGYKYVKID